jgi:hypothetical protein
MTRTSILTTACTALFLASGALFSASQAASNVDTMKACGTQWQAMKTAGTVPAGEKWTDFLKTCAAKTPVAAATTAVPAATPVVKKPHVVASAAAVAPVAAPAAATPRSTSQGKLAEQSRIKECGSEWKTAKAANKVPAGQTWPQFWSACDARLKG